MRAAEDAVAGGANHMLVGRIIGNSWQLGGDLCDMVERHHNPNSNFSRLIALADLLACGISPFPKQASFPMVELLKGDGAVEEVEKTADDGEAADPDAAGESPEDAEASGRGRRRGRSRRRC